MKKSLIFGIAAIFVLFSCLPTSALGADIELAKKSTLESILKKGELRVGFEAAVDVPGLDPVGLQTHTARERPPIAEIPVDGRVDRAPVFGDSAVRSSDG